MIRLKDVEMEYPNGTRAIRGISAAIEMVIIYLFYFHIITSFFENEIIRSLNFTIL